MIVVLVRVLQRNITETGTEIKELAYEMVGAEVFGICAGWQAGDQRILQSSGWIQGSRLQAQEGFLCWEFFLWESSVHLSPSTD